MFTLSDQPIDPRAMKQLIVNPQSGGFVSFEGWVRNHNRGQTVIALHYSAHEKLALQVGKQIIEHAKEKFEINEAACSHRIGQLVIGDLAIWVGVSTDHRQAAFEACQYILSSVKKDVPIWKNEYYENGESGWIENIR